MTPEIIRPRVELVPSSLDGRPPGGGEGLISEAEQRRNAETVAEASAPSTRANYASQFRLFASWYDERGDRPLPASVEMVQTYLNQRFEGVVILGRDFPRSSRRSSG